MHRTRPTIIGSVDSTCPKASLMELNRSVSVFLATTKLLTFAALLIFVSSTNETVYNILMIADEFVPDLYRIPESFTLLTTIVLIQLIITSMCCIYGYARQNRHLLAYYGFSEILMLLWMIYFAGIVLTSNNDDIPRVKLFKRFDANWRARYAVEIYEERYECCGSRFHDDNSNIYRQCPIETDYEICLLDKATLYAALEEDDMLAFLCWLCLAAIGLTIYEVALVFRMIYLLNRHWEESLMYM